MHDGNNNAGEVDPLTASKIAASYDIKIYAIGVGSRDGAVYLVDDPFWKTRGAQPGRQLAEGILKQISENTGGEYFRATDAKSFENIMKRIDSLEKMKLK